MKFVSLYRKCESTGNRDGKKQYLKPDLTYVFKVTV